MPKPNPIHLSVISHLRPHAVVSMQKHIGMMEAHWYVGHGETDAYKEAGAIHVIESGGLCESRNQALEDGVSKDKITIQLSDDLRRLHWAHGQLSSELQPISLQEAIIVLCDALRQTGAQLAGAAPTANPYFSKQRINTKAFIVGDFIAILPSCVLRFDTNFRLKEDYDYTCQHLAYYGKVARVDSLMAEFSHRTNAGGAVAARTPLLEQEMIHRLQQRWPGVFQPNPKRQDEVIMRWNGKKAANKAKGLSQA